MVDKFLSDEVTIINGDKSAVIKADGQAVDPLNNVTTDGVMTFGDEWTRSNTSNDGVTVIEKVTTENIYNIGSSFVIKEGETEPGSTYIYDETKGILTFRDEAISKTNEFGCVYAGTNEIPLYDMVRDLEILSSYSRLSDIGSIYDFQVSQLTFGVYKYANALLCSNISISLGYLSLDKIINDEYTLKKSMNNLHEKYKDDTVNSSKYPAYSGWLDQSEYQNGGWVDIDQLIKKSLNDEWAYDTEASISVKTKKFEDRKRALINIILSYTSSIWELNSSNKIVDFGLRIKDKSTGQVLTYTDVSNGLRKFVGQTICSQFSGQLGSVSKTSDGTNENGQPTGDDCVKTCDKNYFNKCDVLIYSKDCNVEVTNNGSEEDQATGSAHYISPQFKINQLSKYISEKPDILNTIDPIHWTTGNIKAFRDANPSSYKWVDELFSTYGDTVYESQPLIQNRAFHYVGGNIQDGIAVGGFSHIKNTDLSTELWSSSNTYEIWNGSSWLHGGDTPLSRGLGLGGGDSTYYIYAWGVRPNWNINSGEINNADVYPNSLTINGMSNFYEYDNGAWTSLSISPIIEKHSVAGIITASKTGNTTTTVKNEGFSKTQLPNSTECIEACTSNTNDFLAFLGNSSGQLTYKKISSGFCFNGTRGPVILDGRNYCDDMDDTFIFFSNISAVRAKTSEEIKTSPSPTTVSINTQCSYVDQTKKYPVGKTIGTCYVGTGTHGVATGGKTCVPLSSCDGGDARTNKYNRYFSEDKYFENYDSTVKYAYEWNGSTWTRKEDMPEDVAFHCGVGDEKWSIFWGGLHSSVERANVSIAVPGCANWYDVIAAFNGSFNKYGLCGLAGEIKYADFANYFLIPISGAISGSPTLYEYTDYGGNITAAGYRGHFKQTSIPVDGTLQVTVFQNGETVLLDPISVNQPCMCVLACSAASISSDGIIYPDPYSLSSPYSTNWESTTTSVEQLLYNYRYTNLCDLIKNNYNSVSPSNGGGMLQSLNNSSNKWIWTVPNYKFPGGIANEVYYIKRSNSISPRDQGCEVIKYSEAQINEDGASMLRVSRAIVAGSKSYGIGSCFSEFPGPNTIGSFGYGKCDMETISGNPIDGIVDTNFDINGDRIYQEVTPGYMDFDNAKKAFPWVVLGDWGVGGPRGCVDMFDSDGNYWFACGDANNKYIAEVTSPTVNKYVIVMVPKERFSVFNEFAVSRTNMKIANDSLAEFKLIDPYFHVDPLTGLYTNNKSARSREGILEAINAYESQNIFRVYVKLFDYINTGWEFWIDPLTNISGQYELPYADYSIEPPKKVENYDISTQTDINCLTCFTCNDGEDTISGGKWIQHYHEEWISPYIQHPLSGIMARDGFNVWLTASDCPQRWGTSIWTTLDNGRVWVNYRKSRLGVNSLRNHLVYSIITSSFVIDGYNENITSDIPVINKYDEFIFNYSDYSTNAFVMSLVTGSEPLNEKLCDDQSSTFVPHSLWTRCEVSGSCDTFVTYNPSCTSGCSDIYPSLITGCVSGTNYAVDFDPDVGYVEWATNFIMEYKKDSSEENFTNNKYYYKYDINDIGSNCLKDREDIKNNQIIPTSWRRFQDGAGLGGDAPLFNKPDAILGCNSLMTNFIGQKAFGDPDKAIICGGYEILSNGEISKSHWLWEYFTSSPTFKWNRYVVNPEDTLNKNYTYRSLSPIFGNQEQTFSDSSHNVIIFDVSGPATVERYGEAIFNGTGKVNVEFEAFPEFIVNKDKYSITLTPNDNVKVWWDSKAEGKFTIVCELSSWKGKVNWKVMYNEEISKESIDNSDKQTTIDGYEDQ